MPTRILVILLLSVFPAIAQQSAQEDVILDRGEKLLEEAKKAYEDARDKSSVSGFIDAGFKLEEARIKYIVLQEIGSPEKQKLAVDRLRAVNQLSKLIHDGKVAVGGTPAEPAPLKPPAPDPAKPAAPDPPPPPPKPPVDVMKRAPVPEAKKQQEAEKLVKDLFKDQYAKKSAADRKALARQLLDQAGKSPGDLPGLWVLCREAQDAATQGADLDTALGAVDTAVHSFDLDGMAMRGTLLLSWKQAKAPEEYAALTEALLRLIDEYIAADQYDAADKAAALAVLNSKKAVDAVLSGRAAIRTKEIAEAKTLYQTMKGTIQTLAKTPDDGPANLEMGKFLCFVKGSWDLGLRFMVKGSDASFKALAEKELGSVVETEERVALADSWYDLSEKDKSPLRKSQMAVHSRVLYEASLPDTTGLLRAKVEKRLGELTSKDLSTLGTKSSGPIDLLKLVDVKAPVLGEWKAEGGTILGSISPGTGDGHARVLIDYVLPEEYDLSIVAKREEGSGDFFVGLVGGGTQFGVFFDGFAAGNLAGIAIVDGKGPDSGSPHAVQKVFVRGQERALRFKVRKDGVTVLLDGKEFLTWKGKWTSMTLPIQIVVPKKTAAFVGCNAPSSFRIRTLSLTPVSK